MLNSINSVHPFGSVMYGRQYTSQGQYRYGFNSQEKDDEIAGKGNIMSAEYWEYDARLGKRWNIDPVVKPWESSYACFYNNPIHFSDRKGDDPRKEGITNNVSSVTKNKDNSYTIKEQTTIVKNISTENLTAKKGNVTYNATKTVQSVSIINTTTTVDSKGNVLSSSSDIIVRQGTHVSETTETNTKSGRSKTIMGGYGEEKYVGGGKIIARGPFASVASSALKKGNFPIIDDADYRLGVEFGYEETDWGPIIKAGESESDNLIQSIRKTTIIIQNANKYFESMGTKLQENKFKPGYYDLYQKSINSMQNKNGLDYQKAEDKGQPFKN